MSDIIHMTAAYSNAVLVVALPLISDFAKKLELPIPQPITMAQVEKSNTNPWKSHISAGVDLTNKDWFSVDPRGFVDGFLAGTDWFRSVDQFENIRQYQGEDHMTTNDAVAMARAVLLKLGWGPELTHADDPPARIDGPFGSKETETGRIPYCRIAWEWPPSRPNNYVSVDVNMDKKTIVGMFLNFALTNHLSTTPLKVDVVPELESDYRKRMMGGRKIFTDTNAPARFPQSR